MQESLSENDTFTSTCKQCLCSTTTTSTFVKNQKKTLDFGFVKIPLVYANLFFAFCSVAGQVGQNVSLPLWLDSVKEENTSANVTAGRVLARPSLDSYFVYSFSTLCFFVFFGFALLTIKIFKPHRIGRTEREFPQRLMFLVGASGSMTGLLLVFASSGTRTAPYLQAILLNILIPMTVIVRFLILRKVPTMRKFLCASGVVVSLFVCLVPTMFPELDPSGKKDLGGASGWAGVLWPLCFMLAFAPVAIGNVLQEKGLKMKSSRSAAGVNTVYFLFWISFYQFILAAMFFWTDVIPGFGNSNDIHEFAQNWWFGVRCFVGSAGCSPASGVRGAIFICTFIASLIGNCNLLRYAEGATFLAIVMALVTPLGFLFWTLFQEEPFKWNPQAHVSTWFSVGGLVLMVPCIFIYNTGSPDSTEGGRQEVQTYRSCGCHIRDVTEKDPLLNSPTPYRGDTSYSLDV